MEQELITKSLKNMTREERGLEIVKKHKIVKTPKGWRVPSQTKGGAGDTYFVTFNKHKPKCNCPDCQMRRKKCKHIYAVEFYIKRQINEEGKIKETRGVKISYSQDWKAYDKAQINEKILFMKMLKDLCDNLEQPSYKFGRPTLPISEMIFSSALKVYSTFSLRRFMSDMKIAKEMRLIDNTCSYMSVSNYMRKEELTPILKSLISLSSKALKEVENDFAVDSSGFSTSRFARYFSYKHGKEKKYRVWLKAHVMSGVKTNIVTGIEVTQGEGADSPQLPRLVEETAKTFKVGEVSCDKAYSSKKNLELIKNVGAVPYIPFKSNVTGKARGSNYWRKMWYYFMYKHEEFLEKYHKRSNAETVFHMVKTKFRDNLRSKDRIAQTNEVLLKFLCHNICVVIQEMSELGIKGEFILDNKEVGKPN
jgi:transposase